MKITHKEYVETIVDKATDELRKMKEKMEQCYQLCEITNENERVWNRLITEFCASLNPTIYEFVLHKGIPRKQRVSKKGNEDE
jgi:superoxide dismutase